MKRPPISLHRLIPMVLALSLGTAPLPAQQTDTAPVASPATVQAPSGFDPEAATRAYLAQMSPEQKARSDAYFEGGYWLILWDFLYGAIVALIWLQSGWSARLRDWAERRVRIRPLQTFLYWAPYIIGTTLIGFPLSVYEGFIREHKYGLATQNFGGWLGDQVKGLALGIVLGGIAIAVLYEVLRRVRRNWWIWATAVAIVFLVVGILIGPVYLAPIFNKYTKLEDEKIRAPILSLAHANGIETNDVYQVDASRQSNRISANVSGAFGTMRITLNDNMLKRAGVDEIKAAMGHEMGHYVLNHIYKAIVFFGLIFALGFALIQAAFGRVTARYGRAWGLSGSLADIAALPLLGLLLSTYFLVATPITNTITRTQEIEADMFGLNASREPDGFAKIALKLSDYRKMDPGPLEEWIFYDHPSGRYRIFEAMRWKAENLPTKSF